jgi:hypothetical protein
MTQPEYNKDKKNKIGEKSLFSSDALANSIENITKPNFLGSIHMRREFLMNLSSVENLVSGELEMKINKSLKDSLFNPVTKILILLMITFNLIWLLFLFFI